MYSTAQLTFSSFNFCSFIFVIYFIFAIFIAVYKTINKIEINYFLYFVQIWIRLSLVSKHTICLQCKQLRTALIEKQNSQASHDSGTISSRAGKWQNLYREKFRWCTQIIFLTPMSWSLNVLIVELGDINAIISLENVTNNRFNIPVGSFRISMPSHFYFILWKFMIFTAAHADTLHVTSQSHEQVNFFLFYFFVF